MLVVDGSAAMDMAARTEKGMALREIMLEGDEAASPTSLRLDLANRFARFMKMKAVSRKVTLECLEATLTLIDQLVPYEELLPEAFRYIADRELTVDDALYYALARRLDATLLTSNAELAALCRETDVDCIDASEATAPENQACR